MKHSEVHSSESIIVSFLLQFSLYKPIFIEISTHAIKPSRGFKRLENICDGEEKAVILSCVSTDNCFFALLHVCLLTLYLQFAIANYLLKKCYAIMSCIAFKSQTRFSCKALLSSSHKAFKWRQEKRALDWQWNEWSIFFILKTVWKFNTLSARNPKSKVTFSQPRIPVLLSDIVHVRCIFANCHWQFQRVKRNF